MNETRNNWIEICPGIRRRTIAHGPNMYQMLAHLDAGARMPEHHHPQEQIMHVVRGRVRVAVAGEVRELSVGDAVYVPSNAPHAVLETPEETLIIDTFSPPRGDYLALDAQVAS